MRTLNEQTLLNEGSILLVYANYKTLLSNKRSRNGKRCPKSREGFGMNYNVLSLK